MRFVPVLRNFNTGGTVMDAPHFRPIRGFIAGARSGIYAWVPVTLPPQLLPREPSERRPFVGNRNPGIREYKLANADPRMVGKQGNNNA
jgi:hypothetical protein